MLTRPASALQLCTVSVPTPFNVRDYYDVVPPIAPAAGDIWSNLPTFGLLPGGATRAIVITPACDLSNRKVATASYLPIIPLRRYFLSPSFVPTLRRETNKHLAAAGLPLLQEPSTWFAPPPLPTLEAARDGCNNRLRQQCNKNQRVATTRASAGLTLLCACHRPDAACFPQAAFTQAFGENRWQATVQQIVRNSYRLDLFFLPSDGQPTSWSAIPDPSVVLFRYPFSAPIQLLECAQDVQLADWAAVIAELRPLLPGIDAFSARPLKRGTLRAGFLGDLLTRFVSMHVRLGAPDLSDELVGEIVRDITVISQ